MRGIKTNDAEAELGEASRHIFPSEIQARQTLRRATMPPRASLQLASTQLFHVFCLNRVIIHFSPGFESSLLSPLYYDTTSTREKGIEY